MSCTDRDRFVAAIRNRAAAVRLEKRWSDHCLCGFDFGSFTHQHRVNTSCDVLALVFLSAFGQISWVQGAKGIHASQIEPLSNLRCHLRAYDCYFLPIQLVCHFYEANVSLLAAGRPHFRVSSLDASSAFFIPEGCRRARRHLLELAIP